jgi:transcriptional regulator with XRE-family HTH domain
MVTQKTDTEVIGDNIRRIREDKRLSQKELAAAIDVAPTQYSRVETGKVMPALKTLIKITKILQVTLDDLVNEDSTPTKDVTIKDKTLYDKVKLIDELPDSERNMIIQVIDLALSKKKFKDLLQQMD